MGYVIQNEIQNQYKSVWYEHLVKSLENIESICVHITESEIDLENDIYNVSLDIQYKSERIEVSGGKAGTKYVVLIRPITSRARNDYIALENSIVQILDPLWIPNPKYNNINIESSKSLTFFVQWVFATLKMFVIEPIQAILRGQKISDLDANYEKKSAIDQNDTKDSIDKSNQKD